MQQLLAEMAETIAVLEAQIPASPVSPKAKRLQGSLEAELRRYFRQLERALPMDRIAELYFSQVEQ